MEGRALTLGLGSDWVLVACRCRRAGRAGGREGPGRLAFGGNTPAAGRGMEGGGTGWTGQDQTLLQWSRQWTASAWKVPG